ncbi:MAG: triple tyrosine motif-containing protein, partial [Bacteroidota bacterium]
RNIQDVWQTIIRDDGVYFGSYRYLFRLHEDAFSIWEIEGKLDGLFEANGNIYIAGKGKGIQILRNDKLSLLPGTEAFVNWEVRSILSAGRDSLLIATEENGAFIWSNNQISSLDSEVQAFLIENRIYCASQLSNGHYAIGTSHNGLLILDRSAKPLQTINKAYGLLNNSILSVHESKDGNLWLGLENGISFVELNSSFSYLNEHLGIEGTAYSARVHLGKLYLATNQGVYVKDWIGPPDPLAQVPFQQVSGTRGANWNLQNLGGELILGRHYGTARINGFQTKVISDIQGSWKISQLSQYPDFAIEGKYDGLCLYRRDGPSQTWRFVKQLAGFDESSRIFEEDKQGNIWVSHPYRGVFKVKIDPYKAEILSVQSFGAEDGLPSDLFINVCKINQEILFTTEKGVYYFDTQAERFRTHSAFNEVLGDSTQIYRLIEDESGNIWFSVPGEFGMLRIEDNTLQKQVQKLSFDLLQNRLVKGYEFVYAFDERNVFIGTDEGFILYNPLAKVGEGLPLPICLREVVINNGKDSLLYGGVFWENDALLSSQTQSQIKKIDPDFRSLRFSFAAPFFENLNELQYQYRLEGEDEQWSFWTAKTEKEYTNLKPGQYVFWVKARNIFGKESEPISYELIIKPHWYESNFAKSCYFLFALALLFGVVRYQSFRAQRQVEALKMNQAQALEQQEAEYKQEAQRTEAEIIRLRNEKLRGEVAHKNKELASTTMHLVQKGEILLKIKANLQKLAKNANPNNRKTVREISRGPDQSDVQTAPNYCRV